MVNILLGVLCFQFGGFDMYFVQYRQLFAAGVQVSSWESRLSQGELMLETETLR